MIGMKNYPLKSDIFLQGSLEFTFQHPEGVLYKVLYGEAPPQGPYHFKKKKGSPLV